MLEIKKVHLVLLGVFLQSLSFLSIKYASVYSTLSIGLMIVAFGFIIARAYIWQIILQYNELSRVYPFNSLVQVLIFLYAVILFHETITLTNIIGLILMITGLYFIGKKN